MTEEEKLNNIYLNLEIRKSADGKTDENGNYFFEVEASNENVDLQDQIVLQNALMESKDEFLKGGVISYDHLHKRRDNKGNVISDPSMVIGEPVDVKFDTNTKSTVVTGKLYATNDKAKEIIKMLKAGSTRIRASVGGIFPEVVKNLKTGVEKITHVLWNDLALTVSPVNNTVGSAVFAKSMTSAEFIQYLPLEMKKSLCAGYNTDSATKTGGQALVKENVGIKTKDITDTNEIEKSETNTDEEKAIRELMELAQRGRISGEKDAVDFLISRGIDKEKAEEITSEIIEQGGRMMKKSFSSTVSALLKSLTDGNQSNEEIKKGKTSSENEEDDEELNLDDENDSDDEENSDDENEDEEQETDTDEDSEDVDGAKVLKSLDYELNAMRKSMKALRKQNEDLGEAVTGLAKMVRAIGSQKIPPKSVMSKSLDGNAMTAQRSVQRGRPTEEDLYNVQIALKKAVDSGEIDIKKASMISSDVQKCMRTGQPMNNEYYEFLSKALA